MSSHLRIIVSGMIAADPWQGGATWAVLQYVLGLAKLGHDVYFLEPISPKALRPDAGDLEQSDNAAYFRSVTKAFDLENRAALLLSSTEQSVGMPFAELKRIANSADLLLNISGMLQDQALFSPIPKRVYLDLDPAFNQLWHDVQKIDMRLEGHTHFVTIGQAIGEPTCPVPTCGRTWLKTWQPIVLDRWLVAGLIRRNALTTVANWRGYGSIEYQGRFYGQKVHSLRPFFSLPTLTEEKFALALAIHPAETADLERLARNGWDLLNPADVTHTPAAYHDFVQGSKAEFGIAKSGYVASDCGWFSDRSICYLASGRPVLAQETGFSRYLPTGEGVLSFRNVADVLAGIERLNSNYAAHAIRARELAEELFRSDKVLGSLLSRLGF